VRSQWMHLAMKRNLKMWWKYTGTCW